MKDISKDEITENFIKRFNDLLSNYNGTYTELAKAIGLKSKSNITKYANGSLNVTISRLGLIANFFNVSPAWLIGYDDNKDFKFKKKTIELK